MSIEIAQKYGVGVTYKGDDGTLYFKDEAGNVTSLTQADQLAKVSANDTTAGYLNGKLVAGSGVTLTENNNGGNETLTIAAAASTDELAKVSSNDTTAGYLNGKLVAGSNITLTENNNGGNETLTISAAADNDEKTKVSSNDTTSGYLNGKLVAGANITLTENNNGGNETLTIAAAAAPVTSVNTKTGAVTLTNTDVGAAATTHAHAATDITSGTINTARLGSGTANSTTFLRGDNTWATPAGGSGGFSFYDVTLADAENTSSSVTVAKITVPANTWADGQAITMDLACEISNQSGSGQTPYVNAKIGMYNTPIIIGSWPNNLSSKMLIRTTFIRSGGSVHLSSYTKFPDYGFSYPLDLSALAAPQSGLTATAMPSETPLFIMNMDLAIVIQLNTANASYYLRPFHGCAYKTEKGASL